MAKRRRIRWDRVLIVFGPIFLLILILAVSCGHRSGEESSVAGDLITVVTGTSAEPVTTNDAVPVNALPDSLLICIDAGHGGEDGGAVNQDETRFEKDDNLNLALAVRDAFLNYPNVRVIMTRETDVFVELQDRCDIANEANADYFISVHRNSSQSGNGVEIWVNNNDNTRDKLMAEYIMDWLEDVGISERRGVKAGYRNSDSKSETNNFYINRYTNMPSCLIEMGFMTSETDNNNFDIHQAEYAEAIAGALIEMLTDKGLYSAAPQ